MVPLPKYIQTLIKQGHITSRLEQGFPAETISESNSFVSLLFYFGMLTIDGTMKGKTKLSIPNDVVRELFHSCL